MGWGNCGLDSKGRPIGYTHEATCDHPGCDAKIDRGLSYVCGMMHGEDEWSCEGYFCPEHRFTAPVECDHVAIEAGSLCAECCKVVEENEFSTWEGLPEGAPCPFCEGADCSPRGSQAHAIWQQARALQEDTNR